MQLRADRNGFDQHLAIDDLVRAGLVASVFVAQFKLVWKWVDGFAFTIAQRDRKLVGLLVCQVEDEFLAGTCWTLETALAALGEDAILPAKCHNGEERLEALIERRVEPLFLVFATQLARLR